MPLPLTVSCFSKIQIGFTFLVPANPGSPGKGPLNGCVCVCALCNDWVKKCMEYEVEGPRQEEDQRGPGERLSKRTVKLIN